MAFRIVRNDITQMNTEAIVNTANDQPEVGTGCDSAVYMAAGYDKLLAYRKEHIGVVKEGEVFLTPGYNLKAKYIIHAVSPYYVDGNSGEEEKLRSCYRKSLELAKEKGIKSIAFPLISTGSFGYPKEEGMRIAVDEINAFLLHDSMEITLVVFDDKSQTLGKKLFANLEEYIDRNYVEEKQEFEYGKSKKRFGLLNERRSSRECYSASMAMMDEASAMVGNAPREIVTDGYDEFEDALESKLNERMKHLSDTFSQYLMYLISEKKMENADVYKRAIVDKKIFSKIKNNINYHPQKITALCLCIGAMLNLDESRDLLARAGYALSPCDKTDIIFSYFIENEIYDMIELDIQLEEHGLPCIIT